MNLLTQHSETRQKTLEEVAAAFGDRVVTLTDTDLTAEERAFEGKGDEKRIEVAEHA